ncbi:MAG: response regulator transcription factor [Cyanobacteria bacterium P01_D01_bin.36]
MSASLQLPTWRVLIIEDDPLVQLGIEQALAKYPELTVVDTIDDGYLAVESALQHQPDLLLMDIGLPGIDGIETTRQIKAQLPDTKVVMLTSHTAETEVLAAFSSGADAYCIKGGSIDGLLSAIAAVGQGGVYLDSKVAHIALSSFQAKAQDNAKADPEAAIPSDLSDREREVLELLVEGLSNPEIAKQLFISPNTVKAHMRGLMTKLTANDRVQVAVKALRAGLI